MIKTFFCTFSKEKNKDFHSNDIFFNCFLRGTMESITTEEPSLIITDEADDFGPEGIEPTLTSGHINNKKLAVDTIYFLLSVIAGLCTLITVIRTKSVRNQLLGVMLINLAVAMLIRAMVVTTRNIENESRGMDNFGTVGCFLWYNCWIFSKSAVNASIITICLDATFNLPPSRKAQIIGTLCIWGYAIAHTVLELYVILDGPRLDDMSEFNGRFYTCLAGLKSEYNWVYALFFIVFYSIVPSIFALIALIRFCCTHRTNQATQGKKLPFVLTAMLYLILVSIVQVLLACMRYRIIWIDLSFDGYLRLHAILEYGKVVISLIWLFLIPDLRNKCLCREMSIDDSYLSDNKLSFHCI